MQKKSDKDSLSSKLASDQGTTEDSFVFELFSDEEDFEETDDELGFSLGEETPDSLESRSARNGAYSVKSTEEPGMVEDLSAPMPRPKPPPLPPHSINGDPDEGVLGRIALRTVTAKEILARQAGAAAPPTRKKPAPPAVGAPPPPRPAARPAPDPPEPSRMEEPLPPWFEDADELEIAWPWEDGSPRQKQAEAEKVPAAQPAPQKPLTEADPTPVMALPLPSKAGGGDRDTMRAAMDGMVKAALDDWGDETTDAMAGFDSQPTKPMSARKMEELGKFLEKVAAQKQDALRVFLPSQAPLPPDLDEETRQKVEETRALFQNLHVVLQSVWSEGGCQLIPGGPIILDMAMVGPAFDWLQDLLKRRGELRLELSPYELLLHGRTVMKSESERDNPFFYLYQEGVRLLTLLPGLSESEFKELFRVLTRGAPGEEEQEDTTTQLWELDLPHLKISSTSATPDQLLGFMGPRAMAAHRSLVRKLNKSLHGENAFTDPSMLGGGPDAALLREVLKLRTELVRSLEQVSGDDAYRQIRSQIRNLDKEQVQRLVHTVLEMMSATGQSNNGVVAAIGLLRQLLIRGRWAEVGVFCRTLGQARGNGNPEHVQRSANLVRTGLAKLLDRKLLKAMEPALEVAEKEEFHGFRELVRVLPKAADMGLAMVTEHVENEEIKALVFELVKERGVNVDLLLTRRILSEDDNEVLEGIARLKANPSRGSIEALRSTLVHDNPEVRMAALKVLQGHLGEDMIPDLVDCLELDHDPLKNICFDLLHRMRPASVALYLIPLLESVAAEWSSAHRRKAIAVLARAGDTESLAFLVNHITTRNLLRDAAVEEFRTELVQTLAEVGGLFARKVLHESLEQSSSFGGGRSTIQEALDRMSGKS